ncbi:glutaredoxin family protein [Lysinibacillus capsici]|uniref:glutaredoxin family protein n=1 Tax=Lysinibacillus capsici TaxID=2115968 RepID=UPI00215336BD|nr:glutaredoxin family protein [Lysinibacillus capsici]MCR6525378.1 glutaredoxin family protein [Lysinibacillus capsici]
MNNKRVTVYFSDYCGHCTKLKKWLNEREIPFISMNTEDPDVSSYLQERGINAVPFTIIENKETNEKEEILGFNLDKFQNIFSE